MDATPDPPSPVHHINSDTRSPVTPRKGQKSMRAISPRSCNFCATRESRYWRRDLVDDGYLCNNCGMNQRRGRDRSVLGNYRSVPSAATLLSPSPSITLMEDGEQSLFSLCMTPSITRSADRSCYNCCTINSVGKWRIDQRNSEHFLCHKCGLNQRRSLEKEKRRISCCSKCKQKLPIFRNECGCLICGECGPFLIKTGKCMCESTLNTLKLGAFLDKSIFI